MELFESELIDENQNQTAGAVEPEPRYQPAEAILPPQSNENGHTWIRTIGLILAALVLVVLIVLFARWAYHRVHHSSTNGSGKVSVNPKLSDEANKLAAGDSSSSSSSSAGRTATPPPTTPSATGNPAISNAGPGNVVGLFVGTSLAAAGLHFVLSLRRFNRT